MPPSPNSMLLHRFAGKGLQKKQPFRFGCRHALGNNIDQGGAGGAGVMWQHVGGWLFFLKNPGKIFWFMDVQTQAWRNSLLHLPKPQSKHTFIFKASTQETKKHNIYLFGLMALQTQAWTNSCLHVPKPNPNTLSSSQLLPTNKDATLQHLLRMWAKIVDRKLCVLHDALNVECASAPPEAELQRSAAENRRGHKHRVLHSARTVHAQCTLQCTPQCTATKRCKYHVFSEKWWEHKKKDFLFFNKKIKKR